MEPDKKKKIMEDLTTFSKAEEFYSRIARAWKRGYLLYGPPGTGKFTMIAAMANLLGYDIYDLELTAVKDNTELRKLLIETSSKSIIFIEDIDCSLDLTGQRRKKNEKEEQEDMKDPRQKLTKEEPKTSQVTLSGLLNFIDGLWIQELLAAARMTPAEVAEHLMPKTASGDPETCLESLIQALESAKEEARLKAEKEAKDKELSSQEEATEIQVLADKNVRDENSVH
ncbi:hypothetical protein CRYUN_Cryun15aG0029800 [Craigia yunnanensis]